MSSTKIFYTEDGNYFSEEYNRAIVDEVAFGGELNHTKLYGSQEIFRSPLPYLFVSSTVSDANGTLQSKKNVGVELQDVNGLTVIFDAAGGTHPKKMDVVLISKTLPNFANVYKSQSFKDDLVTRVSDTGFLPGTAFDAATGDRIDHAGTMTTGYITGASDITIRTRGIDWNKVDRKACGVNLHRKWLSGNKMAPVWYGFATAESLIASTSAYDGFGKMTIDADGNAEIKIGAIVQSDFFEICVSEGAVENTDEVIISVNEEITYGANETAKSEEYIGGVAVTYVTDPVCYVECSAENVGIIGLILYDTNAPYIRHKLTTIYLGKMQMYTEEEIVSCDIIEQCDPISETLPISTCDVTMIEENGFEYNQAKLQRMEVYRDDELRGVYVIDGVRKSGGKTYSITSHSWCGELDKSTFVGDVYRERDAVDLACEIFRAAGLPYKVDVAGAPVTKISGHIPMTDCRSAMRSVLFASGLYIDESRSPVPRICSIDINDQSADHRIEDVLIGETVTDETRIASIEMKTRQYIDQYDEQTSEHTSVVYTWKEYGKGYKPIIIIPEKPSVMWRNKYAEASRALMPGSSANRVLWDGTQLYNTTNESGQMTNTDQWAVDLYPYIVKESAVIVTVPMMRGGTIVYDNTMMSSANAKTIAERCLTWYLRDQTIVAGIVGDVRIGENIEMEISDGVRFAGTVTQIRYALIGSKMIQEVTARGFNNRPNARRL